MVGLVTVLLSAFLTSRNNSPLTASIIVEVRLVGWETVEDENLTVVIARNSGIHRDEGSYCKCSEHGGFDWLALYLGQAE